MVRSHWLRVRDARLSPPCSDSVSLRLRDCNPLASPRTATRRLILQKTRRKLLCPRHLGGPWFQVLFHSPRRGSFRLSLTVLLRYRWPQSIQPWIVVDPDSGRVPRAPPYSGTASRRRGALRVRGCHPLRRSSPAPSAARPDSFPSAGHPHAALQPRSRRFGLLPFRSPLLRESLLISSPALLRWFTSRGVAPPGYFIRPRGARLPARGLPHSATPGSQDVCSSPGLFAACRGLHRLAAPRHPPWTCSRLAILPLPLSYLLVSSSFPITFKQLSLLLGQNRVELLTPALSERCSNQLSYCPVRRHNGSLRQGKKKSMKRARIAAHTCRFPSLRKEVIQPHLPVRLPCYDFTPLAGHTFESGPLSVGLPASGIPDSDGVTGGVYKARERIHRAVLMRDY